MQNICHHFICMVILLKFCKLRILYIHIRGTANEGTGLRIKMYKDHPAGNRHIIIHSKRSLLYHQNSPWTKKNSDSMFDVTMGSYDGAETCELIGVYMLSLIAPKFKDEVGLYRDDGIAVCKAEPREKAKQEVSNVFKFNGLKITIEANKKVVNFLDVTFDLSSGSYKPYIKPNNKLLYVHRPINHPRHY